MPIPIPHNMHLFVSNFDNGGIHQMSVPLYQKIDAAWLIFTDNHHNPKLKKNAEAFLAFALNIPNETDSLLLQITKRMKEREDKILENPEFVPNQAPKDIKKTNLLSVNAQDRDLDKTGNTRYFDAIQRARYQVVIHDGLFKKLDTTEFSTSHMIAHLKHGFGAFTINKNGEISIFPHRGGVGPEGKIFHSSMNAGDDVFSAGEIKIENGKLKAINTYSGHYEPTMFHIYQTLEYFRSHGVDVSETKIYTWNDPARFLVVKSSIEGFSGGQQYYATNANEFIQGVERVFYDNISEMDDIIEIYRAKKEKGSLIDSILEFLGLKSDLANKRADLANNFSQEIRGIAKDVSLSPEDKAGKASVIVENYQKINNLLGQNYGKKEGSGELNQKFNQFKFDLQKVKEQSKEELKEEKLQHLKNTY